MITKKQSLFKNLITIQILNTKKKDNGRTQVILSFILYKFGLPITYCKYFLRKPNPHVIVFCLYNACMASFKFINIKLIV